jgi:iron(III) transport system permease protein
LAWLLARTDLPGKAVIVFMFWVAFFLPTLPVVLGWILLLDPDFGIINRFPTWLLALRESPFNIYSF